MKQGISVSSELKKLERAQRRLGAARRLLWLILPLVLLTAVVDLTRWIAQARQPVAGLVPVLDELQGPLADIPEIAWTTALFHPPTPAKPTLQTAPAGSAPVRWKLLGISVEGQNRRAFLRDEEGAQKIWVREGDLLGNARVKEIGEGKVVLEEGGGSYEIRM